jgi:hypothetical protein
MPMREDCVHYESRAYADDGEVARFCTLDLAPEAPWKCPEHCPKYERLALLTGDIDAGSLADTPPVEDEPDEDPDAIADVLADAEAIVEAAEPAALAEVDQSAPPPRKHWWQRKRSDPPPDDGEDFRLSNR